MAQPPPCNYPRCDSDWFRADSNGTVWYHFCPSGNRVGWVDEERSAAWWAQRDREMAEAQRRRADAKDGELIKSVPIGWTPGRPDGAPGELPSERSRAAVDHELGEDTP